MFRDLKDRLSQRRVERRAVATDELVVVEVAGNQAEAEMLCSLLRSAGIVCLPRLTNRGAGAGEGWGIGGQHEIMVKSKDAPTARKILRRP